MKAIFLVSIICLFGCSNPTESQKLESISDELVVDSIENSTPEVDRPKNKNGFYLKEWHSKFLYRVPIKVFNEDSVARFSALAWTNSDGNTLRFEPVIGELAKKIEGLQKLEKWHMTINEGTNFLYSVQRNDRFVGITLAGMNDAWVDEIKYLTFNLNGEKVGEFILAARGGDGGYYTRGHGKFLNDSSYVYSYIETGLNWETKEDEVLETGTITTKIDRNGKVHSITKKSKG